MADYSGFYGKTTSIEEMAEVHKKSFQLYVDKTSVDLIAFETIPCREEVKAILSILPSRPNAKVYISLACNSGSTLHSGATVKDCVRDIEETDVKH